MREVFTTGEARARGLTAAELRWGEGRRWVRLARGVYAMGPESPDPLTRALGVVVRRDGVASGCMAGVLHGLDSVNLRGADVTVPPHTSGSGPGIRRRRLAPERIVSIGGYRCTDGLQTLVDLAALLDSEAWEQALESALRKHLLAVDHLSEELFEMSRARTPGIRTVRDVLAHRPADAPPTESLLETLMVQLVRGIPALAAPVRQLSVSDRDGYSVARVDLAWPGLGLFVELDGQHHLGQPLYDASRETAIVAATGWLCGRFTWTEVTRTPTSTARRMAALAGQARLRPPSTSFTSATAGSLPSFVERQAS